MARQKTTSVLDGALAAGFITAEDLTTQMSPAHAYKAVALTSGDVPGWEVWYAVPGGDRVFLGVVSRKGTKAADYARACLQWPKHAAGILLLSNAPKATVQTL